jgi:phosphoenolpyruvate carboxylase
MPTIDQAGRLQVDLLRRYRAAETDDDRNEALHRLLLSINCVAAGFGATG